MRVGEQSLDEDEGDDAADEGYVDFVVDDVADEDEDELASILASQDLHKEHQESYFPLVDCLPFVVKCNNLDQSPM